MSGFLVFSSSMHCEPQQTAKRNAVCVSTVPTQGSTSFVDAGGTVRVHADQDKEVIVFNAARPAARAMIALGAFIMWFTWYGFNIGSLGGISGRSGVAAHAMLITTLAGMSGAVTSVVCTKFTSCFSFTISTTCNGVNFAPSSFCFLAHHLYSFESP